jgi:hypothetical protein
MADSKNPRQIPPVKKDFERAANPPVPRPVSRIEQKQLEAQRAKPPALTNTIPPSSLDRTSQKQADRQSQEREARIKHIQERLSAQRGKARTAFDKARGR